MGESTAQIEQLIGRQRNQLEADVQQLQQQLRAMVDWRIQTRRHPWRAAATVFLASYLAGILFGRLIRRSRPAPTR